VNLFEQNAQQTLYRAVSNGATTNTSPIHAGFSLNHIDLYNSNNNNSNVKGRRQDW